MHAHMEKYSGRSMYPTFWNTCLAVELRRPASMTARTWPRWWGNRPAKSRADVLLLTAKPL
eukprot:15450562-Alexandrium_andersonii.AAC.1